jgi:hypothetical protein
MIRCPSCSAESPDRGRFRLSCGAPLTLAAAASAAATVAIPHKSAAISSSAIEAIFRAFLP